MADSAAPTTQISPPWRRFTRPRLGLLVSREIALILGGLLVYRLVRLFVKDEIDQAFENSRRVIGWEQTMGIFTEEHLQDWIIHNDAVIWGLNRYYFFAHFLGTFIWLSWLFFRHHDQYGRVRRVLFGTTFSALAIHLLFPLAPPRWFPGMGFVDTLQTYGPKIYDSEAIANTANQIAAMPSLHVGWAVIGAWGAIKASRSRWRWFTLAHPFIMTAAVVLTANHWWLDAAVALVLVGLVTLVDAPIQRRLEARRLRRELDEMLASEDATTPVTVS